MCIRARTILPASAPRAASPATVFQIPRPAFSRKSSIWSPTRASGWTNPTAPRTRLKMDEILTKSKALGRPVTFQDLSGRWAVDRSYGRSIEGDRSIVSAAHCGGQQLMSSDGRSLRQRMSADWPRPGPGPEKSMASVRDSSGAEPAARSNLGRLAKSNDAARDSEPEQRPARKPKRPLQKPIVTSSLRKSDEPEAASQPPRAAAQRVLPAAPPPIIKPKPPAEQQARPASAPPSTIAGSRPLPLRLALPKARQYRKRATGARRHPRLDKARRRSSLPSVSSPASAAPPVGTARSPHAAAPPTTGSDRPRPARQRHARFSAPAMAVQRPS